MERGMSDETIDEAALERFGEAIADLQDEALDARHDLGSVRSRLLRRPEPGGPSRGWLAFAGVGLAAVAALVIVVLRPAEPETALAFTLPDGSAGGAGSFVSADAPEAIAFADGSALELAAGSDLRFAEVDADGARLDLQRGRVRLDVVHRDDATRWAVQAGPFAVDVVGTRFAVGWDPETRAFELHMEEGRVELEGPNLERRAVVAGQTVRISVPDESAPVAELELPEGEELASVGSEAVTDPAEGRPTRRRREADLDWRRLAREGRHRDAVRAADWDRLLATGDPADLITLGDAARFAGESEKAAAAYQAIRVRHPEDARAPQAAFFLGRLALARGDHAGAASFFDAAASEAPGGPFAAVSEGRRIEAYAAAGDAPAARQAARAYLDRWPDGAHATAAHRVLGEEPLAVPMRMQRAHAD